jgi:hypothetical protein
LIGPTVLGHTATRRERGGGKGKMSCNNGEPLEKMTGHSKAEVKEMTAMGVQMLEAGVMKMEKERKDLHNLLVQKITENAEAIHIQTLKEILAEKDAEIAKLKKDIKEFPGFMRRQTSKWPWPLNYFL